METSRLSSAYIEPLGVTEDAIIGAVLLEPGLVNVYNIESGLFWAQYKQRIIDWVWDRLDKGRPADWVSLLDEAANRDPEKPLLKLAERYGGNEYITSVSDRGCISLAIPHYMRELRRFKKNRELQYKLVEASEYLADPSKDPSDIAELIAHDASQIAGDNDEIEAIEPLADAVMSTETDRMRNDRPRYLPTNIPGWDDSAHTDGISSEGITLVIGASGMGKTSVLNRLVLGMSESVPVYLHGSETTPQRRVTDMLLSLSGVDAQSWAGLNDRSDPQWMYPKIVDAHRELRGLPIQVSGAGLGMSVDRVCSNARRLHARGQCGVLVVDYLQDLEHVAREGMRRGDITSQVNYASKRLKELSAELGIPVIVGAQVSGEKDGVNRGDPRPKMWQVQWSSAAHQDAEEVYGLFRDDYYADRFENWKQVGAPGVIEVIALKRRTGALRTISLPFDGPSKWVGRRW